MKVAMHLTCYLPVIIVLAADLCVGIRFSARISETSIIDTTNQQQLPTAIFALGSFWRSEAVFGCLDGVVRTTVGYAGGSKANPEYRSLGDHAESKRPWRFCNMTVHEVIANGLATIGFSHPINFALVTFQLDFFSCPPALSESGRVIEYDPKGITFKQLLEVFWTSYDSRQVFGQGPDVGNQHRSIVFTNGTEESRLASASKEREQTRSKSDIVTTQIQQLGTFYPAEPDHQKFELKRNPFLLQLMGNLLEEELEKSSLAAKLNGYAAELCPPRLQKRIHAKINDILRKAWPILREV
nr:peptide methionine sulfoxide reductase A5-like [Coffea arabica]XP_027071879.1 peptide methionine sulfoxide reductase A5-like [Coffea arabica]